MAEPDQIMAEIGRGIALHQQGRSAEARSLFSTLWVRIGATGDALHRCALAHSMADVQNDPADELTWDLRALDAADSITDDRVRQAGIASPVEGFYPSLHLNAADAYRRLGDPDSARRHLRLGRSRLDALAADGYLEMVRDGLDRLQARLDGR